MAHIRINNQYTIGQYSMIYKLIIVLSLAIFILGGCMHLNASGKDQRIYKYYPQNASEAKSYMYFGPGNYFYQDLGKGQIEKTLEFPSIYGFTPALSMGGGADVHSIFSAGKMPDAAMVRWFSPLEDRVWLAQFKFDQSFIDALKQYTIHDPFYSVEYTRFIDPKDAFSLVVNVGYAGRAAIWLSARGESYLLGSEVGFEESIADSEWCYFMRPTTLIKNREEAIAWSRENMDDAGKRDYQNGTLDMSGKPWDRKMRRYNWNVIGGNYFKMTDFQGKFTNGEQYYIYEEGGNRFRTQHAAPIWLHMIVQDRYQHDHYERVHVNFDPEYIMKTFERFTAKDPNTPLSLKVDIDKAMENITLTLYGPDYHEELKFIDATLLDLKR